MSISGFRIYYLEDEKSEFDLLRSGLQLHNHFFPVEEQWKTEMQTVHQYLVKGPDSEQKGKEILEALKGYQPDIFIFDYYLVGNEGVSTAIYDLIRKDDSLKKVPVIFLTVHMDQGDLPIGTNSSYVVKNNPSNAGNLPELLKRLEIEFWQYQALLRARIHTATSTTFSEWIRNNF